MPTNVPICRSLLVEWASGLVYLTQKAAFQRSPPENLQPYCSSPLLLAIIVYSLVKGKLFFPRSKSSLLRRDARRGLDFPQQ